MLPVRFLLGSSLVLALLAASAADAMPPLVEGDLIGLDQGALRRLDGGPANSENVFSGEAIRLKAFNANPNFCSTGRFDVDANGDAIAYDGLRNTLVHIELETSAWHVIAGLDVGTGAALRVLNPIVEPSGSILWLDGSVIRRIDPTTGDRSVFLAAPAPPTEPGVFAEFYPRAIGVRPDGTIAMYSVVTSTGVTQAQLIDVDPVTAARTPRAFLNPTIIVAAVAATENGDALLLSADRVQAVNALGEVRTLSGNGVGAGPALQSTQALATDGTNAIYVTQRAGSPSDNVLIAIDPATGNRELVANPAPEFPQDADYGDIAVAPDGSVLVLSCGPNLLRIDPETGVREIAFDPLVGSGSAIAQGFGFLGIDRRRVQPMTGGQSAYVLRVEPTTGERDIVSSRTVGTGPNLNLQSPDVGLDGDVFAFPSSCGQTIFRIDSQTGDRTIVSQNGFAPPYWFCANSLAAGDDGFLYVVDLGVVHRVNPVTGGRSILSDSTHGSGPLWPSNGFGRLERGPAGTLLGVGGQEFFQIDVATGDRSLFFDLDTAVVDSTLAGWVVLSFALEADDGLAIVFDSVSSTSTGLFSTRLLRVDRTTGAVIEDSLGFYGPIAVVPEPAAALLALVATAALAANAARRAHR